MTVNQEKEPLGKLKNPGRTYRKKGDLEKVKNFDFPDKELGKAVPCGVCDHTYNEAGVSVGISRDAAEFAVSAIERWWIRLGQAKYPGATRLLITADSGGGTSPRTRLLRWALKQLANTTGMSIELCHYPPNTTAVVFLSAINASADDVGDRLRLILSRVLQRPPCKDGGGM